MSTYKIFYRNSKPSMIHNVEKGLDIPIDAANRDYRAYLSWAASGGIAEEVILTPPKESDPIKDGLLFVLNNLILTDEKLNAERKAIISKLMGGQQ